MDLILCGGCRRHVRADAATCPFCAATVEPSKASRLARAALTAGLAATCSVTLAACYGGPPIRGVDHGPLRWKVQASSSEFLSEFSRRATAASCDVVDDRGGVTVTCKHPDARLGLWPAPEGVSITCEDGTPADCVTVFERIRSTEPSSSPAAEPSSSAPPLRPIAPPEGATQ